MYSFSLCTHQQRHITITNKAEIAKHESSLNKFNQRTFCTGKHNLGEKLFFYSYSALKTHVTFFFNDSYSYLEEKF